MMALKGLGVAGVSSTGGSIASVADAGAAGIFAEDRPVLARMRSAKNLGDGADVFIGVEKLSAVGVKGAEA